MSKLIAFANARRFFLLPLSVSAVPVAMALMCASNPDLAVLDILSKLSHDADAETAYNAIMAMGIVGAGTNHARIADLLRHLAQYYSKDADVLFIVRTAQVRRDTFPSGQMEVFGFTKFFGFVLFRFSFE